MPPQSTRVLVSYSHDSVDHDNRVLDLCDRLRREGVDCEVDQYEPFPEEGWPRWMERQIREATFVLVICTQAYCERFENNAPAGVGKGSRWEGAIITQELYESEGRNSKFIPVLLAPGDQLSVPGLLKNATRFDLSADDGYERLYRYLTRQPAIIRPELGRVRPMPPRERHESFSVEPHGPAARSGRLRPSREENRADSRPASYRYRIQNSTFQTGVPEGIVAQPFGPLVPVSIRRVRDGLFVSAVISDLDGTEVGSIRDNRWEVYEGRPVRWNRSASALEVVGRFGVPLLQVDYIDSTTFRLQGAFHVLSDHASRIYSPAEFPAEDPASSRYHAVTPGGPGIWVFGSPEWFLIDGETARREWDRFVDRAKRNLKTWFP